MDSGIAQNVQIGNSRNCTAKEMHLHNLCANIGVVNSAVSYSPVNVGQRIQIAREAMGKTQTELAVAIGVKPSGIGNWEKGRQRPSIPFAEKICRELDIELNWLLLGSWDHLPGWKRRQLTEADTGKSLD